jgi:hypothetical protein
MFKTIAAAAALIVGAALSSPVAAQSFTPAPGNYVLSGTLTFELTYISTCDATIDISVDAAGDATVTAVDLSGGWSCGAMVTPLGTWTILPVGWNDVIMVIGVTGHYCYGAVNASLTAWPTYSEIVIPAYSPIPSIGAPNFSCLVSGVLYSDGPLGIGP